MQVFDFFVIRKGNKFLYTDDQNNITYTSKINSTWFESLRAAKHFLKKNNIENSSIENYVIYHEEITL